MIKKYVVGGLFLAGNVLTVARGAYYRFSILCNDPDSECIIRTILCTGPGIGGAGGGRQPLSCPSFRTVIDCVVFGSADSAPLQVDSFGSVGGTVQYRRCIEGAEGTGPVSTDSFTFAVKDTYCKFISCAGFDAGIRIRFGSRICNLFPAASLRPGVETVFDSTSHTIPTDLHALRSIGHRTDLGCCKVRDCFAGTGFTAYRPVAVKTAYGEIIGRIIFSARPEIRGTGSTVKRTPTAAFRTIIDPVSRCAFD